MLKIRKKHMKRYLFLLAAALLLFSSAACGNSSNIKILEDMNTQPEYLNFFSQKTMLNSDVAKYWIDRFTQTHKRKVYINFDGATYYADEGLSYRELLEKRLNSSAPDDLYIINAEDVLEFEKKGYWMDLSGMDFVDNLSDAALYQSTYNGKVFSVPLSFTGFGFLWNVDLLEKNSLPVPQNLEEFLTVCEALKNNGILPYGGNKGFALTVPAMAAGLSKLYENTDRTVQDKKIASLNSGETHISAYLREGYELLSLMIEKEYMDPEQALAATPRQDDIELFLSGKCAFICIALSDLYEMQDETFQVELTGLPLLSNGSITVYGANYRLCVNPNSKHLETVCKFIEMIGAPEALEKSAQLDHTISSAKASKTVSYPSAEKIVELLQQPGQIPNQDFSLHFNTWESIRDAARELCGGASVDQTCALLDQKQQADLKEYGKR